MPVTTDPATDERRVWVWGLPLVSCTRVQVVDAAKELVASGIPSFFVTANSHYAMLCNGDEELKAVNLKAAFVVADGFPLVWASRYLGSPLPERVAGSDLIYDLCDMAAREGFAVFFLGGAPGVAEEAGRRLVDRFPSLRVVGTESPPFRQLSPLESERLERKIGEARTDILILASAMPSGELWIAKNASRIGVPLSVNLGASLDFVAGRVNRAPKFYQRIGMEWAYRIWTEPRRLAPRYAYNARFIARMLLRDLKRVFRPDVSPPDPEAVS